MTGGGSGPRGRSEFRAVIEVSGVAETRAAILEMGARAYNTMPLMTELTGVLFESQRERVQQAPWVPLASSTVTRKEEQGSNPAILRDEPRKIGGTPTRSRDALYMALTVDGAPGQVKRATRTWAIFGADSAGNHSLFYARFVQNVKGKKRRLLAINEATAALVTERVANWIRPGMTGV